MSILLSFTDFLRVHAEGQNKIDTALSTQYSVIMQNKKHKPDR